MDFLSLQLNAVGLINIKHFLKQTGVCVCVCVWLFYHNKF